MPETNSIIALINAPPECITWYQQGKWEGIMKAVKLLRQYGRWPRCPSNLADDLEQAAQPWKPKKEGRHA